MTALIERAYQLAGAVIKLRLPSEPLGARRGSGPANKQAGERPGKQQFSV